VRLEDPPGLSHITTVGRYNTVEEAQVATDEVGASRGRRTVERPCFSNRPNHVSAGNDTRDLSTCPNPRRVLARVGVVPMRNGGDDSGQRFRGPVVTPPPYRAGSLVEHRGHRDECSTENQAR
jgi:hypothetical protein